MTTDTSVRDAVRAHDLHDPAFQAFVLLRTTFTLAPILFGLDKSPTC